MHANQPARRRRPVAWLAGALAWGTWTLLAGEPALPNPVTVLDVQNHATITRQGSDSPDPAYRGQVLRPGDRGRTYQASSLALRLSDSSVVRIRENSVFEIQAPPPAGRKAGFSLMKGLAYFFSREKPLEVQVRTLTAIAAIRGTEFALQQQEDGRTVLTLFDGEVELRNLQDQMIPLKSREQGIVQPGQPPRKTAWVEAVNVIQWFLYYPGVLDLDELALPQPEQEALANSLAAWRRGDLLQAVTNYPAGRAPALPAERLYVAALALAVGNIDQAAAQLDSVEQEKDAHALSLAQAMRKLIAAVRLEPAPPKLGAPFATNSPTAWLAESYYQQSQANLPAALRAARTAVQLSTNFAFGWARVAELEFSFGHLHAAQTALERGLALAPHNAQALALKGFLLAADNRLPEALACFDKAIAVDGSLGNAWLGRGLCLIRQGHRAAGRADLQTAAAMEPNRSFLRSYLGKAWTEAKQPALAAKELDLAKKLDPRDPTPWLYAALLNRELNRINPAIDDLEKSVELNDNRRVYRSSFLLDEDRAVRSSSLANIYQSAGMTEVSVREAAKAVSYDYANYSAHQFLAESFDALRDPTRFNVRYETPWFNEWLLATLLSPVGGTPLAQHISQEEYARFFEQDRLGLVSQTEYRSDGQVREVASQFGNYRSVGYALDLDYQHNDGVRPNNQLDRLEVYGTFKYQVTPQDAVLLFTKFQDYHSGDNFQYYDTSQARPSFYYDEYQTPGALMGGYHREWAPGVHTLLLGGRLANDQRLGDLSLTNYLAIRDPLHTIAYLSGTGFDETYRNQFEIYSGELNQIFQWNRNTLVVGARYQSGTFTTEDLVNLSANAQGLAGMFPRPPALNNVETAFERAAGYAYWTWEIIPHLLVTPGVAYDAIHYPRNYSHPPINGAETEQSQVGPKAGLVWNPMAGMTVRGAYTRSLGGVGFDESYRLEPTQLAGFSQAFRNLMPETLAGAVSAPEFETAGLGLDLKFKSRTYATIQGELLESQATSLLGVFDSKFFPLFASPATLTENLDYHERALAVTVNQLVANEWSLGAHYRFAHAELESALPEVPLKVYGGAKRQDEGDLHQVGVFVLYNHPAGWFARADLNWYIQDSLIRTYPDGFAQETAVPGESFPQLNLLAGYRFKNQRGEIALGILNLTGTDYHLNPINLYEELPRERVFYARLRLRF
jgi:tetratricopeptide (TPR) repeat protein